MYCNNCGKQIKDDAKFCPFCGMTTEEEGSPVNTDDYDGCTVELPGRKRKPVKKKKASKGKIIFFSVFGVVVVAALASLIFVFASPAYQLISRLDKQDYNRVETIYDSKVKGDMIQRLLADRFLLSGVSGIMKDYGANKVDYEIAEAYLETVGKLSGIDASDEATYQLEKLETLSASKAAYEAAEAYYAAGDYASAISEYQNVSKEDTENYENAQNQIQSATDSYKTQILEKVGTPATADEFKTAITLVETALKVLTDDAELTAKLNELNSGYASNVKATAMSEGTDAIAAENYSKAFDLIQVALELNPDDSDLLALLSSSEATYENYIIDIADEYIADENYNKAITELNTALKVLPNSTVLNNKLNEVKDAQPISLSTLTPINGGFTWDEGTPEDPFGNVFNDAVNYSIFPGGEWGGREYSAEYRLYGEYSELNFSVAPQEDIPEDGEAQVQIFADDHLIFTSDTIHRKTDRTDYSVKINNAEYIKIVVNVYNRGNTLILFDCTLEK
jgi:tetratricopeptide (TPR) repeat protein